MSVISPVEHMISQISLVLSVRSIWVSKIRNKRDSNNFRIKKKEEKVYLLSNLQHALYSQWKPEFPSISNVNDGGFGGCLLPFLDNLKSI